MQVVKTVVRILAAALFVHAGIAAADTAELRLDELQKRIRGSGGPPTANSPGAPQPSVEQALEWYGLIGASYRIKELEQKADGLVFGSGVRNALDQQMKALEAQSQTRAVTAAEGGISEGSRGLGWYCRKVAELETTIPERMQGFRLIVADYKAQLGVIPRRQPVPTRAIRPASSRRCSRMRSSRPRNCARKWPTHGPNACRRSRGWTANTRASSKRTSGRLKTSA